MADGLYTTTGCMPNDAGKSQGKGPFKKYVRAEGGRGYPGKRTKTYKGEGGSSKSVRTLVQFSQSKYLQSILNKRSCPLNIIHTRSHSRVFLHKYVVIFRGIRQVSNFAHFELTEIYNIFKCLGGLLK